MRRGTKIQKLKQALPGIVKDVRHYAKPRVKLHNEGLGDYSSLILGFDIA